MMRKCDGRKCTCGRPALAGAVLCARCAFVRGADRARISSGFEQMRADFNDDLDRYCEKIDAGFEQIRAKLNADSDMLNLADGAEVEALIESSKPDEPA